MLKILSLLATNNIINNMRTIIFTLLTLFSTIQFAQEGTFNGKDAAYWTNNAELDRIFDEDAERED